MMMQILQALVFLAIAVPFLYMAFDVGRELSVQTVKIVNKKIKPGMNNLTQMILK